MRRNDYHWRWSIAQWIATAVALGGLAAWSSPALAVITLDADFDHGSLCLVPSTACDDNGTASSVDGNTVTLVGRDNFNTGQWKWIYFAASGVDGQNVTFEIGDDFTTGSASLINHAMVYSYDQHNWQFFDNNDLLSAEDMFVFSNDTPFSQDTVYVAYGLPYPYQRVVEHTASIDDSLWVSPTSEDDDDLVVGLSPGGTDDIGRVIPQHNLYGYKITDPNYDGPKKIVVVAGGVHSNETLGNFTLEGLVDFLVSDELAAAQLRRSAEFYVYPMVNPDGRFAGYNRSTVQALDVDPNRVWDLATNYGGQTDIRNVGQAMRFNTGEDIDYLIDFHSTVNPQTYDYHHGLVLPEWQLDPFWQAVLSREPELITGGATLVTFTLAKFGRDLLNAEFSATFETEFVAGENVDRFLSLGRNFGLAWHEVFYLPADLNYDGALDVNDWLTFIAVAETDMTGLSEIERYDLGDLDGDGENSISDFALFKQYYLQANGDGSFAAMLSGVPEPSALLLATAAAMVLGCRDPRHLLS